MAEFIVLEGGFLAERAIHELADWYASKCPGIDSETFEAHLMVLRAYIALATPTRESPVGTRIPRSKYNVLRLLYQAEGKKLSMSEIGKGLNVSPTNITKLVNGLVGDGYVRRVVNPDDKRSAWAELTDAGKSVFEEALPGVGRHTQELWSTLSRREKKVLAHLLAKLRLNFFTLGGTAQAMDIARQEDYYPARALA